MTLTPDLYCIIHQNLCSADSRNTCLNLYHGCVLNFVQEECDSIVLNVNTLIGLANQGP
jgi:hypothetical protein